MSWAHLEWSYKQEVLSSSQKSVLVNLAFHANDETGNAYPSIPLITKETELDRKTVMAALDALVEAGWIQETGQFAGRTKQIKVYRLHRVLTVPKTEPLPHQTVEKQSRKSPNNSPVTSGETVPLPVPKTGHGILNPESGNPKEEGGKGTPPLSSAEMIVRQDELKEIRKGIQQWRERRKSLKEFGSQPTQEMFDELRALEDREADLLEVLGMSPLLGNAAKREKRKEKAADTLPHKVEGDSNVTAQHWVEMRETIAAIGNSKRCVIDVPDHSKGF